MRRRAILVAGAGALAAGATLAWWRRGGDSGGGAERLFASAFTTPEGAPAPMSAWRGKPLVVNFWATWCPPCVDEMPDLEALHREWGGKVNLVGIGIDSAAKIVEFRQKVAVSYPLVVAGVETAALTRELGNEAGGLPFTVVFDAEGRIRERILGRVRPDALRATLRAVGA